MKDISDHPLMLLQVEAEQCDAQALFGDPVVWEKKANTAVVMAKRAMKEDRRNETPNLNPNPAPGLKDPDNFELVNKYQEAKKEYVAAAAAKRAVAPVSAKKKAPPSKICFKFESGECTRGDTCKFIHDIAEKGIEAEVVAGKS